jgi:hypothetical protein
MFIIVSPLAALVNSQRFRRRLERGIFPTEQPIPSHH